MQFDGMRKPLDLMTPACRDVSMLCYEPVLPTSAETRAIKYSWSVVGRLEGDACFSLSTNSAGGCHPFVFSILPRLPVDAAGVVCLEPLGCRVDIVRSREDMVDPRGVGRLSDEAVRVALGHQPSTGRNCWSINRLVGRLPCYPWFSSVLR